MASGFCQVFTKGDETREAGRAFYDGSAREPPGATGERYLRAIDAATGRIAWESRLRESVRTNWSGVAWTAGGPVFFADNAGTFSVARIADGDVLWSRHLKARVRAPPCHTCWAASNSWP